MQALTIALLAVFHVLGPSGTCCAAQTAPAAKANLDEALRREGEILSNMADAALAGRAAGGEITLAWTNDFFKAQPGTFVPFTIRFTAPELTSRAALMYVRVERRGQAARPSARQAPAYETIFPVKVEARAGDAVSLTRGFAVPPGQYRLVVVLREAPGTVQGPMAQRKAGSLVLDLAVPDFWTGELAVSTVMLADRVEVLKDPIHADELDEDPYVVGSHRIHRAQTAAFSRSKELLAVFLIYNPSVGADRHFDVQVDYHVFRKHSEGTGPGTSPSDARGAPPGERYVTRTTPQRFSPAMMGSQFDPAAGTPILAGQGILLSGFDPGDYRLEITVTDLLSRKSLSRNVAFSVVGF
jgi:hypothetical protein